MIRSIRHAVNQAFDLVHQQYVNRLTLLRGFWSARLCKQACSQKKNIFLAMQIEHLAQTTHPPATLSVIP
jgi:hypothetical protein